MPPAAHIVTSPRRRSRRSSSSSTVPIRIEPVAPIRVAQRHRPAVHVHLLAVELQIADEFLGDDGESLVDLPQVDVVFGQAGLGQHLARRRHRGVEHQRRAVAHVGHGDDAGARLHAVLVGIALRRQQHRRRAVDDARRIAGVVDVLDLQVRIDLPDQAGERGALLVDRHLGHHLERRLQAGEAFLGGLRTGKLFPVQRQAAVFVEHRHQALVEPAFADGHGGALLADHGKVVHRIARDAFQGGDGVGADALVRLRMLGAQAHVAAVHQISRPVRVGAGGGVGHHLGAPRDH